MNVAPSATFEATCSGFATGLAGTLGVRVLDNAGATTTARVTAGIAEYPSGSGIYYVSLTAPATAGQYTILFDSGIVSPSAVAVEDLNVTVNAVAETRSPIANPSQPFTAWAQGFATGLTGTLGVRIVDNAGGTTTARTTNGIAEPIASSGIYFASLVAPSTYGQYEIVWDDGTSYAAEDLTVGVIEGAVSLAAASSGSLTATPGSAGTLTPSGSSQGSLTLTPASVGSLTLS